MGSKGCGQVMRVLHVCEVSSGGVLSLVRTYAQAQAASGGDSHVLVPADARPIAATAHTWTPTRRGIHRYPSAIRRLHEVVDHVQPDVVHLHSFFPGLLGRLRRSTLSGRAVIYQPHSWAFEATTAPGAATVVRAWERVAARRAQLIVTNCADELHEGRRGGVHAPARVVGLPVDTDHFAPVAEPRRKELRAELDLTADRVVVCVGRISYQKGQDQLVETWERQPIPNTVLVLVGAGDTTATARTAPRTWGSSIRAVGAQTDVRPWLWAADLSIMPSRYEGQSVAMGEALSCGRPVVMTDVNGGWEAVGGGDWERAGAVVPLGDMSALLAQCRRRLDDATLLAAESVAARDRAVRLFAVDEVIARLDAAYRTAKDELAAGGKIHSQGGTTP